MTAVSPTSPSLSCYQFLPSCASGLSLIPLFPSSPSSSASIMTARPDSFSKPLPILSDAKVQSLSSCPEPSDQATLGALASYIVKRLPELAERARMLQREEEELDRRIKSLESNVRKLGGRESGLRDVMADVDTSPSRRRRKRGAEALNSEDNRTTVRFSYPVLVDDDIQIPSGNTDVLLQHTISLRSRRKGRVFLDVEADAIAEGNTKRRRLD
ncbi:hypothetical protein NEOLEDRAFT_1178840 [Neolentinus lepideus HHB14362 ss-1]|uniref:Uncharacterized protein n=1 Tax=Neolentinus lepideus HHB14362 ss-1 TaxID=1314782 RepID=A0A165SFX5_9AGAM|nr:hypothetical protein NEOLEDRAFT_1178840 [Neolentinus lepideus HHB14362 ss-1]